MEQPFQPEPPTEHELMVLKKNFTLDLTALGKEFDFEKKQSQKRSLLLSQIAGH